MIIDKYQPVSMKEEALPDIPEEDVPHAHSMYEQLRKTSQKWFTRSHHRIFPPPAVSAANDSLPLFSPRGASSVSREEAGTWTVDSRVLALMRQQIEIAVGECASRFKSLLQEQAKYFWMKPRKIKLLGDLLLRNQMQLQKKNEEINVLIRMVDNREQELCKKIGMEGLEERVMKTEADLEGLVCAINSTTRRGEETKMKLVSLEKQNKEKLIKISSNLTSKVGQIIQDFEERIDKLEKIIALGQNDRPTRRAGNPSPAPNHKILENITNELQDLRQEVESFKRKKYRYENYKFEEVQAQIEAIHAKLHKYQQGCRAKGAESKLNSSQATHTTYTTHASCVDPRLDNKRSQTSKTRFLNKYKSLINSRPEGRVARRQQSCSSGSESQVEATIVNRGQQDNVKRLKMVVRQMGYATPLRIEIDQTGYAKSTDSGMYLVDALGNGFEFSEGELRRLEADGVIVI